MRRFGKFLAKWFFDKFPYEGKVRMAAYLLVGWWAWVDLNHRPRPYQGLLWCYMHSSVAMITLLTTSLSRSGKPLRAPMPQFHMTRSDAEAVVAYLKSLNASQ